MLNSPVLIRLPVPQYSSTEMATIGPGKQPEVLPSQRVRKQLMQFFLFLVLPNQLSLYLFCLNPCCLAIYLPQLVGAVPALAETDQYWPLCSCSMLYGTFATACNAVLRAGASVGLSC